MKYLLALAALAALQPALADRSVEPNALEEESVIIISHQAANILLGESHSTPRTIDQLSA